MTRLKIFAIMVLSLCFLYIGMANSEQDLTPFDQNHTIFNNLLEENVHDAKVNYEAFLNSDEFTNYLISLNNISKVDYDSWTENQRLAFWINAYNAFTIKAIINNYPIQRSFTFTGIFYAPKNSILQIRGVWKKLQFKAVGQNVTLDHIEHGILRKEFNEPRIHVAINCASFSCPDLKDEAYTAEKLESQLNDSAISFVNNKSKGVVIDKEKGRVKVSKIFKWFGEDFYNNYGSKQLSNKSRKENGARSFVAEYINEDDKNYILNGEYKLSYMSYDWSLNETKNN